MHDDEAARRLARPVRQSAPDALFEIPPDWREHWWQMPSFRMRDATALHQVVVNFMTREDIECFSQLTGLPVAETSSSTWFPHQLRLNGSYEYDGGPVPNKYPICLPSKGRADCQRTARVLDRMGLPYRFFVEKTEFREYVRHLGRERVVRMPFHDLGKGSIPARNYIWDWARDHGHRRHWVVDDNIIAFARCNDNRRLCVRGGGFFRAMEDFVDRYENIALAGPHERGFMPDRNGRASPYLLNTRVYSCILIDTTLPDRWRGRYNEDTDLSLRLLKQGWCTLVFRALLMRKWSTVGVVGAKALRGGNTDHVYNTGDHRREFAESIARQHPDVARVVWRFNRWHHLVDYSLFRHNKLRLKPGVVPVPGDNEYGMKLVRTKKLAK
jgi:hypothetical protein